MVINFKTNPPEFGDSVRKDTTIRTKRPSEIFEKTKKSKGLTFLDIKCCCNSTNCKNGIYFYYAGLSHYCSSSNLASDTEVNINLSSHQENEEMANNVMWIPTEDNVAEFVAFSETSREAIAFKQELLIGLYATLQVRIEGYDETQIIVRKEENEIRFILFEIPNAFSNVPLLRESTRYRECLGVIATLPIDTDTSKIENEHADMRNPFFEPVTTWVKSLGETNQLDIAISSIWVMPE